MAILFTYFRKKKNLLPDLHMTHLSEETYRLLWF